MTSTERTSIVYNDPNKIVGLPPYYYRWRSMTTANQYQRLKLIQNTVRVHSSLYTSNKGPLSSYRKPTEATHNVCWNQMSDRPVPSVQKATVPTGYGTSMNRRHTSVTSSRPGCQTPGGAGCDIKHNSYDRYLNRIKGKGPLRRGPVPPTFGSPIPYNPAFPVYGGKTVKTNLVNGCSCPEDAPKSQDVRLYENSQCQPEASGGGRRTFSVGDYVYAKEGTNNFFTRAIILSIEIAPGDVYVYTVEFDNGTVQTVTQVLVYFPCNCGITIDDVYYVNGVINETFTNSSACYLTLNALTNSPALD